MAAKHAASSLQSLRRPLRQDPLMQCLTPGLSRSLATEVSIQSPTNLDNHFALSSNFRRPPPPIPQVLTTIYSFPTMEPTRFAHYPANHLHIPLRRDILHRAVIFEGDSARQGTASTKWRDDVEYGGRKIRPQKGTGRARLGDRRSPMLRGGGVAFGPHPRDFSTKLPKKVYDLAWRMALSYRYRRGELTVVEDGVDLEVGEARWLGKILRANRMGNKDGRSLIVTKEIRENLWLAAAGAGQHGKAKTELDVDVKDILELGRIVMEKGVLDSILKSHSSDLEKKVHTAVY